MAVVTEAQRRLLEQLRVVDVLTVRELSERLGLTDTAVRQHLGALVAAGLVDRRSLDGAGRGRPPTGWSLSGAGAAAFTDGHRDLLVELLAEVRAWAGPSAAAELLGPRTARQVRHYRQAMAAAGADELDERVRVLARLRSAEGYLAEAVGPDATGACELVEHHCPVAGAAGACPELCAAELEVFAAALGAPVERTRHLLRGDRRCSYRIRPPAGDRGGPACPT
jgi:predicted ArsR family transcriptional regulator